MLLETFYVKSYLTFALWLCHFLLLSGHQNAQSWWHLRLDHVQNMLIWRQIFVPGVSKKAGTFLDFVFCQLWTFLHFFVYICWRNKIKFHHATFHLFTERGTRNLWLCKFETRYEERVSCAKEAVLKGCLKARII